MRYNNRLAVCTVLIWLVLVVQAFAGTRVWGFYGWGDNWFGTSSGIDDIAAQARTIPGVVSVQIHNYWDTQGAANEIMAAPSGDKIVLYGYSCGANAITMFGNVPRTINTIAGMQQSLWCGGVPVPANVRYAQQTYGGCVQTGGLGCKKYKPGTGFTGRIRNIRRESRHGPADNDYYYQRDVLIAIAGTAGALRGYVQPPGHHPPPECAHGECESGEHPPSHHPPPHHGHGECPTCTQPPHHN